MTVERSRDATRARIRATLAADCACAAAVFVDDGVLITPAEARTGRRLYPLPAKPLLVVTMGRGVVVSCAAEWVEPLRALLGARARDAVFAAATIAELARFVEAAGDGETLRGPAVSHACAPETFRRPADPAGIAIEVFEGNAVHGLYRHPGFGHALSYRPDHPRPDVAAAVARRAGRIVGMAGMSADCQALWQIGIDVVAEERGAGVGRALVGVGRAVRQGAVPARPAPVPR